MEGKALNWELKDLDPIPVLPSKLDFPLWVLISPPVKYEVTIQNQQEIASLGSMTEVDPGFVGPEAS